MCAAPSESRLRVVVLTGGNSPEREVSLRSGAAVAAALLAAGHYVSLIDPAECPLDAVDWRALDACFVALHGGAGEDGRIQQELERFDVPYTGSGPDACRLAMSKSASKERFIRCGVPTPPYVLIDAEDSAAHVAERVAPLGYPLIVKPDAQGSSIGVSVVESAGELASALAFARHDGRTCLAERLIREREFTVAVLDDRALPTIEIVTPERFFSYEAKYASSLTEHRFEFDLPEALRDETSRAAVAAARSLGTSGLARVDVMLDYDGRVWVLEVNTIPGMTARSLAPEAAQRAGLDMPELCELLVRQCLATAGVS
jgi:D-alanine-D-alanine ligase